MKFIVEKQTVTRTKLSVEAETAAEVTEKVKNGEGDVIEEKVIGMSIKGQPEKVKET
jgi:hypothetical protein